MVRFGKGKKLFLGVMLATLIVLGGTSLALAEEKVISVDPLGMLFGVINAEYEQKLSPNQSVTLSGSLLMQSIGAWKMTGFSAGLGTRRYTRESAPEGF